MASLAILLIGFSLFSTASIALSHFGHERYRDQPGARVFGLLLLLALALLQLMHFGWLQFDWEWVALPVYRMTLYVVAPAFYLFSLPLLQPERVSGWSASIFLHALPALGALLLPATVAMPLAFVVGAGYLLWLARQIHGLRQERARFAWEITLLGAVFLIAITVSVLGLVQSTLPDKLFYQLYASAIGLALFLVQTVLALRPQLPAEVSESARAAYANSSLTQVDCTAALARLDHTLTTDRRYCDADLSLPKLAGLIGLSQHQLSELLNSRLGKGFSRYLRELRVAAAKTMLLDEPNASVLSVGLSVGFSSQSTFYEAFREIEGMTPGQFRKLQAVNGRASSTS